MSTDCFKRLYNNFERDCAQPIQGGLEETAYLINFKDIDRAGAQLSASRGRIHRLVLKPGAKLYRAKGYNAHKSGYELIKGEYGDGYKHSYTLSIAFNDEKSRDNILNMIGGGRFVAIVENKNKGLHQSVPYEVLGFDVGLEVAVNAGASSENSGVASLELSTKEGDEESSMPKILLFKDKEGKDDLKGTEEFLKANAHAG